MTQYLPSPDGMKKGFWGKLWGGITSVFMPQKYTADKNQETQFYLEASRQAQNQQLHEERQALQKAEMQLRAWQHQSNLDFQAEQQEANRQTQIMLADAQRLLTLQEGERNRAMMRELEELRQEFQAHENQLSREHSLKVEEFRVNMQRWVIAEQKATQLRMKEIDVTACAGVAFV